MQHEVKSAGRKAPKGELHKITVEKAGNGFTVTKHHKPADERMYGGTESAPAVFTKHAPAKAHIAAAMEEMHPVLPVNSGGSEAMPGATPVSPAGPVE